MSWLASIFTGILSGALGLVAAGFVANACVYWYRISGFEGKSGYFVVFTALFGGFLAFYAAMLMFLRGKAKEPFEWAQRPFYLRFNTDVRRERAKAFRELCEKVGADATPYLLRHAKQR